MDELRFARYENSGNVPPGETKTVMVIETAFMNIAAKHHDAVNNAFLEFIKKVQEMVEPDQADEPDEEKRLSMTSNIDAMFQNDETIPFYQQLEFKHKMKEFFDFKKHGEQNG